MAVKVSRMFTIYGPKKVDQRLVEVARRWAEERKLLEKDDRDGIKIVGSQQQIDEIDDLLYKEAKSIGFRFHKLTPLGRKLAAEEKAAAAAAKAAAKAAAAPATEKPAAAAAAKPAEKAAAVAKPAEKAADAKAEAKPAEKKADDAKTAERPAEKADDAKAADAKDAPEAKKDA